jgi:hypothetical protein
VVPFVSVGDTPSAGDRIEDAELKSWPPQAIIDELAHVVVAHARSGAELPAPLRVAAGLFSVQLASGREANGTDGDATGSRS